jgi:hypothetical protein
VTVDGKKFSTNKMHLTVVPAGQAPRRAPDPFGNPFGGFDPFRGLLQPFGDQPLQPEDVQTDPKLGLDSARGSVVFLHATIDKTQAVVGEQVTLSIYMYQDLSEREVDPSDIHEATASDFVRHPLFEDDTNNRPVGNGLVAGRPWAVKLVRRVALFPLKTGDLEIGPMSLSLLRVRGDAHRESETLHVHVTEPPVTGRPPGYRVGDVGNFALSAEISPRDVEREGAVGVTVELSGTGDLPSALVVPVRAGIEWLPPEVHEKMGAASGDRFGGKRTLSYVVRLHKEGDVDLGAFTLPFYNPDTRKYAVAQASLGVVHVKPGAAPVAAEAAADPLQGIPPPRTARTGLPTAGRHVADSPLFWAGLGVPPLGFVLASGLIGVLRAARQRRAEVKASPETELKERMQIAEKACKNGDAKAGYAAIARALESATIARAGVNVRDATSAQVARRLEEHGVPSEAASRFEELLKTCEAARFSPELSAGAPLAQEWQRAKDVISSLGRSA